MPLTELLPGSHTEPAAGTKGSVHSGGPEWGGKRGSEQSAPGVEFAWDLVLA